MNYNEEFMEYVSEDRNILEVSDKVNELAVKRADEIIKGLEYNLIIETRALEIAVVSLGNEILKKIEDGDNLVLLGLGVENHMGQMITLDNLLKEKIIEKKDLEV